MKVAIISDIHGNIHALEAVLADIRETGVDRIIVNGDLVNRGPSNTQVMARLGAAEVNVTLGNHDALVVSWNDRSDEIPVEWYDDPFWNSTNWAANQLRESGHLEPLRALPIVHEIAVPGAPSVLVSHGSPRNFREGYGPYLPDAHYLEIIRDYPADIYVGSHTHRPFERRIEGRTFLNSGAVGAPFNRDLRAQYLLMTLEGEQWKWEFRGVAYDRDAAIEAFDRSGFLPYGDVSGLIFKLELVYARPIYPVFWTWAESRGCAMDWNAWNAFMQEFGDKLAPPEAGLER